MAKFVIAEPGGGLFQGEFLGLLFCYSGPDSDLPVSEILFFNTEMDAQLCIEEIQKGAAANASPSLEILNRMRVECVDGVDLTELAIRVYQEK